jgi:hypothetical protein
LPQRGSLKFREAHKSGNRTKQYATRAALGANAEAPPTPSTQTIMQYLQSGQAQ